MMKKEEAKRIEIKGLGDKKQIMAVFGGTLTGEFLPIQLVYQGSTTRCHPNFSSLMTGTLLILTTTGVMKLQ